MFFRFVCLLLVAYGFLLPVSAQTSKIPAPKDVLGFTPGEDKKLASWNQVLDYFDKLDKASNRVKVETLGKSTLGVPFVTAYISAPENLAKLDYYKQINAKLADPRLIKSNDATAKSLIKQGKTIVLITCGVHSNEVGSYLSSMLMAHRLASSNEPEIQKILRETIIILVPSLNPDGVDIIKNWYDKTLGTAYEGTEPPELYNKYVGHDDNRDWYAFTQLETQLTVDKIHNVWHPQIVHDIHQMGETGARIWLPPYMKPVEPNVPPQIVEGYTELGKAMMGEMIGKNYTGIANDSIFDAWTPARAYSHYHGGVRILSETASCKLATPIELKTENLRLGLGYDPKKESPNHPKVWQGGRWGLPEITDYITTAAFALMKHSADNREQWLTRFYSIGKEAVRPRKNGELWGYIIDYSNSKNAYFLEEVLEKSGVEIKKAKEFSLNGKIYEDWTPIIRLDQPYSGFAKAMIETQKYPNLLDEKGNLVPPYDVTAHNLALLAGISVDKIFQPFQIPREPKPLADSPPIIDFADFKNEFGKKSSAKILLYKSYVPNMDEGWTRYVFEDKSISRDLTPKDFQRNKYETTLNYRSVFYPEIRKGDFSQAKTIIFPDQSPNQMLNGHAKGTMPDEFTGGIGAEGVENLRKFAEDGGTLVFLNRASNFAIEQFNLPVRDVTKGVERKDFYIPGSILRTELDTTSPLAKGMEAQSIAWFENSPAFEVTDNSMVKIIARYPAKKEDILLSGWASGEEKLAGKAALVEVQIGKGKIILFGFRPQYRGQSLATFQLLFNSISR